MHGIRTRKVVGESSRCFALPKSPIAYTEFLFGECERAVRMRRQFIPDWKADGDGRLENAIYLGHQMPDDFIPGAGLGEVAVQLRECFGALLSPPIGFALSADASHELAEDQR